MAEQEVRGGKHRIPLRAGPGRAINYSYTIDCSRKEFLKRGLAFKSLFLGSGKVVRGIVLVPQS